MLTRLSQTIDRIASLRSVLLVFLVLLPFIFIFFPWRSRQFEAAAGHPLQTLDTRLPYPPQVVLQLAGELGQSGRRLYALTEVTLDFAFPVLYATWFSLLLAWVWRGARPAWSGRSGLARLPYLGMLGDFLENICLAALMLLFPNEPAGLVWFSNLASLLKWGAGLASLVIILAGAGVCALRFFARFRTGSHERS